MQREVTEDEAALLDALATNRSVEETGARLRAHAEQCAADLEVARRTLERFETEHRGFALTGSKAVLELVNKVRGA